MRLSGTEVQVRRIETILLKNGCHAKRNGDGQNPSRLRVKVFIIGSMPVRLISDKRYFTGQVTISDSDLLPVCAKIPSLTPVMSRMKRIPKHNGNGRS